MIWLAIIGYLACSVEAYFTLRAVCRRGICGSWTCGTRLFTMGFAALGPMGLLVAIFTALTFFILDNDKPARW